MLACWYTVTFPFIHSLYSLIPYILLQNSGVLFYFHLNLQYFSYLFIFTLNFTQISEYYFIFHFFSTKLSSTTIFQPKFNIYIIF